MVMASTTPQQDTFGLFINYNDELGRYIDRNRPGAGSSFKDIQNYISYYKEYLKGQSFIQSVYQTTDNLNTDSKTGLPKKTQVTPDTVYIKYGKDIQSLPTKTNQVSKPWVVHLNTALDNAGYSPDMNEVTNKALVGIVKRQVAQLGIELDDKGNIVSPTFSEGGIEYANRVINKMISGIQQNYASGVDNPFQSDWVQEATGLMTDEYTKLLLVNQGIDVKDIPTTASQTFQQLKQEVYDNLSQGKGLDDLKNLDKVIYETESYYKRQAEQGQREPFLTNLTTYQGNVLKRLIQTAEERALTPEEMATFNKVVSGFDMPTQADYRDKLTMANAKFQGNTSASSDAKARITQLLERYNNNLWTEKEQQEWDTLTGKNGATTLLTPEDQQWAQNEMQTDTDILNKGKAETILDRWMSDRADTNPTSINSWEEDEWNKQLQIAGVDPEAYKQKRKDMEEAARQTGLRGTGGLFMRTPGAPAYSKPRRSLVG